MIGQTLSNTTWSVYNVGGSFGSYWHFDLDTLSFGSNTNPINHSRWSTYRVSNDTFWIVDLPTRPCPLDTGIYTFTINANELEFTPILDVCMWNRGEILRDYTWIQVPISNLKIEPTDDLRVFPNPVNKVLFLETTEEYVGSTYFLYDYLGREILSNLIHTKNMSLDLGFLEKGIYFLKLEGEANKLVKIQKT
jgi:hypothetical protein